MGETFASTAAEPFDQWFAVDRDYRIIEGMTRHGIVECRRGQVLWDAFPGSRELYEAFYEEAWNAPVEKLEFHLGSLNRVHAEAHGDELHIRFRMLSAVDVNTWASLRRSVDRIQDLLEAEEAARSGRAATASLRLV